MLQRISELSPDESGTNNSLTAGQWCTDCRQSSVVFGLVEQHDTGLQRDQIQCL
jgi:hypothetical protein